MINNETLNAETLNIKDAAKFLHMSVSGLYKKAKKLGVKPGKKWCFYKPNLINYLNGSEKLKGNINLSWQSTNEEKKVSIKLNSQPQTVSEYERVLGLKSVNKHKN